jgi:hypothetical protein
MDEHRETSAIDFAANYSRMADEELLALSEQNQTLLPSAQRALEAEIQRRGIVNGVTILEAPPVYVSAKLIHEESSAEYAETYAAMADEQLLKVAGEKENLVPAALAPLGTELQRRGLPDARPLAPHSSAPEATWRPEGSSARWGEWKTGFNRAEKDGPRSILEATARSHDFYVASLKLYREHWRLFVAVVLPAALLAQLTYVLRRIVLQPLIERELVSPSASTMIKIALTSLAGNTAGWVVLCAGFAAIAIAVSRLRTEQHVLAWHCYREVWRKVVAIGWASLLFGALVWVGVALSGIVSALGFLVSKPLAVGVPFPSAATIILWLMLLTVLSGIARVGFTIPAAALDELGPLTALQTSERLSKGYRFQVWIALVECEIVTTIVFSLTQWASNAIASAVAVPDWVWYGVGGLRACLYGCVQIPMMIGVTLLYLQARDKLNIDRAQAVGGRA